MATSLALSFLRKKINKQENKGKLVRFYWTVSYMILKLSPELP